MKKISKIRCGGAKIRRGGFLLILFSIIASLPLYAISPASQSDACYHYLLGNIAEFKGDVNSAIEEYKKSISYDTDSVYLKKNLISLYILAGNVEAASELASTMAKANPADKSMNKLEAELSIYGKKPEEAIPTYEKILLTEPANKEALYNIGILYSQVGSYEKAISCFKKYLQLEPDSQEVNVSIGILYQKLGFLSEAETYLRRAAELSGNSTGPLLLLAELYEQKNDFDKAIETYDKLIKMSPEDADLPIKAARLCILKKDYPSAKKYLQNAKELFPKNYLVHFYLGLLAIDEKDYDAAIKYFDESIELDKKSPEPHIQKGYVFTVLVNTKKAVESFEKAESLGANIPDVDFFLALNYEVLNKYDKSEIYLKKAAEAEPQNLKYHFELGVVYDKLKKSKEAEEEFFKTIEIDSTTSQAYNYLGYVWADKNIKLNEAEEFIKKALALEPENPAYIDSLGWVYYRQAKYSEALVMLKKAAEGLDDPEILGHLGDCYLALGDVQMAVDSWESSVSMEKNKDVLKKINSYGKNLVWSKDMVKLRAVRVFSQIQDVSGFLKAGTVYKNKGYGISGPVFFKKPKQLRIEISGLFSEPEGLIIMRQGTIVFVTRDKKTYDLTPDLFWVKDIFNVFDSEYLDGLNFVAEEKESYIFKNDLLKIKVDKKEHTIFLIKFVNGSSINLSDYELSGKINFPHKLVFVDSTGETKTTLLLDKLNFNHKISIDLFNLPGEK